MRRPLDLPRAGDRHPDRQRRIIQKDILPTGAHGHFPDRVRLIPRVFEHPTEPTLQIEPHRRIKHAPVDEIPYAVPFGDEPFTAKDAQGFPYRSPAGGTILPRKEACDPGRIACGPDRGWPLSLPHTGVPVAP